MKVQLLPSTIDEDGRASARQHLLTMVVDDRVAVDAGCLAFSCTRLQRRQVRDILLTHTHLDHVAGLPMYIDDLFAGLEGPIRIHATAEMSAILERDIFNWSIYPRFSELSNRNGKVLEYVEFERDGRFHAAHLEVRGVPVNHKVSAVGYILSDGVGSIAITGDTAETDDFWEICNASPDLTAIFVECAFPDEMQELAVASDHLNPARLKKELAKLDRSNIPVFAINLKPMYRERVVEELRSLELPNLQVMDVGSVYNF